MIRNENLPPRFFAKRRERRQLTDDERQEIKNAFEIFDVSKKGTIDLHELGVLLSAMGYTIARQYVAKMVYDIDPKNDGYVDCDIFLDIMAELYLKRNIDEEIDKAFELFDSSGKEEITAEDLRRVAYQVGERLSNDEIEAMIEEFDRDQDGGINREEFRKIMHESTIF